MKRVWLLQVCDVQGAQKQKLHKQAACVHEPRGKDTNWRRG